MSNKITFLCVFLIFLAGTGFAWQAGKGQMSAKLNGESWKANGSCSYMLIKTTLAITGTDKNGKNLIRLVVKDYKGPGSYVFNAADVTWEGNYFALSVNKTTVEGKFTVNRADDGEVEGTFSFYCVPLAQNPRESPKVVAEGKFTAIGR